MFYERIKANWLMLSCGVLLLLLLLAAVLQYRWINRVSEADRQQQREFLDSSLRNFRNEFTTSLQEPLPVFRPTLLLRPGTALEPYLAGLQEQWKTTAIHPQMLSAISLGIENLEKNLVFKRRKAGEDKFTEQPWPDELAWSHEVLERGLERHRGGPPLMTGASFFELVEGRPVIAFQLIEAASDLPIPAVDADRQPPPAIQPDDHAAFRRPHRDEGPRPELRGWCFLEIDPDYLRANVLPELIARHFGTTGYQTAVMTGKPPHLIYQSDAALAPEAFVSAEARTIIFSHQFQGPRGRPPFADGDGRRLRGRPPAPGAMRGARPDFPGVPRDEPIEPNAWQLVVKYKSGSLETLVTQTRRRNLALSFGILLLLAGSMLVLLLATRRARRLAQQQMEFVAGVSHELRTPLAVIQSSSYNLANGLIEDPRRVQQYGTVIQSEVRRLINQVEQVMSFAGIQSGNKQYDLRPTRLAEVIHHAFAEYEPVFRDAGWQIEKNISDDLPVIAADAQALESVIKNLLQNALKYAADGKWISISASISQPPKRSAVQITIADHGPGIEAADVPHIFDPFYRSNKVLASTTAGSGLGLSLVKRHLEAHRGTVSVTTSRESGTAFTLHLPIFNRSENSNSKANHTDDTPNLTGRR